VPLLKGRLQLFKHRLNMLRELLANIRGSSPQACVGVCLVLAYFVILVLVAVRRVKDGDLS
jgi:hypothetical protein